MSKWGIWSRARVLLWGPSHPHFALHSPCWICASMSCWNGTIPQDQITGTIFEEDSYSSCNELFSPLMPIFTVFPMSPSARFRWADLMVASLLWFPSPCSLFWQHNFFTLKLGSPGTGFPWSNGKKIQKIKNFWIMLNPEKSRLNSSHIFLTLHAFLY